MDNIINIIDTDNKGITLSNDLIEAKYKLSALEQKIIHLLLSQINLKDEDLKYYSLHIKDFAKLFTKNNNDYVREIKAALEQLLTTKIEIKTGEVVLMTTWFASAAYFKGGKIEIEFSQRLKPYLIGLKKSFTNYNLDYIIEFRSSYSIRLYQLLKQYQKIGKREITVLALKEYLHIEKEYQKYSHFKEKVLKVTYNEINKSADISFDFEEIKKGRRVNSIKFYISTNQKQIEQNISKEEPEKEPDIDDLVDQLRKIIKEELATKEYKAILAAAQNDINLITTKYNIAKKQGNIDNLVGWLIKAVETDYSEPTSKRAQSKNKFNDFPQRQYSEEELEELERRLLLKDLEI